MPNAVSRQNHLQPKDISGFRNQEIFSVNQTNTIKISQFKKIHYMSDANENEYMISQPTYQQKRKKSLIITGDAKKKHLYFGVILADDKMDDFSLFKPCSLFLIFSIIRQFY